jgi:hypothetical protein
MVKVYLKIHICLIIRYRGSSVNVLHREKFNLMFFFTILLMRVHWIGCSDIYPLRFKI